MPYSVSNTDGSITVSVADSTVDTSTYSLALVGRNVSNYGAYFVQNTIRHLENFASAVAPTPGTTLTGQIWYDKGDEVLRVYDGTMWKSATGISVGSAPTTSLSAGTAYFNTILDKLYVYDGTTFKVAGYSGEVSSAYSATTNIGSPTNYGTKLRNIFLKDSIGVDRAVLALVYVNDSADGSINQGTTTTTSGRETLMAIISDHDVFTVASSSSSTEGETINWFPELSGAGGIGTTIRPGINLRTEYSGTALALSERTYRADAAYRLNLGTVGSDGSNISASDVIWSGGAGYVPSVDNSSVLGSSTRRFANTFTGTIYLGNGTNGSLLTAGTVSIGNATNYVNHVYANNITVADVINFSTADLGTSGSPIQNAFFANATISTALNTTSITKTGVDGSGDIGQSGNRFNSVFATTFNGTATTARYADLAEKYLADAEYEVGTVVAVGGEAEVTASATGDRALGVVSGSPAYMMNSELEGGTYIALKGRVPVKVVGAVNKGDKLVATDNGCAQVGAGYDVFAIALESSNETNLKLIEAVVL
jgi:hypothetical protein